MYIKLNLDIDMSIDEVIEHATADVNFYENQLELLEEKGYTLSDTSTNQIYDAIRYSKSIIKLLGDLKLLRLDSCMIHMPERLHLVENGYNKALNNVESEFLMCDKVHYNLQDILNVLNKVKAGGKNENTRLLRNKEMRL